MVVEDCQYQALIFKTGLLRNLIIPRIACYPIDSFLLYINTSPTTMPLLYSKKCFQLFKTQRKPAWENAIEQKVGSQTSLSSLTSTRGFSRFCSLDL